MIPVPPSTNALYTNVPGKGRVKTARYKTWITEAGWAAKVSAGPGNLPSFRGAVAVAIEVPRSSRIDLDNIKAVPDLLVSLGIIADDRLIDELHVRRIERRLLRVTIGLLGEIGDAGIVCGLLERKAD